MNMAGHDAIGIYFHAFVSPTIIEAIADNIEIFIPYKNIYPIDGGKTDKVQSIFIVKLIFPTHRLNITSCGKYRSEQNARTSNMDKLAPARG